MKTGAGGAHITTTAAAKTTAMPINTECRQIIEIFDYCLHLLNISSASQHSIINAALEVINAVLQALDAAANNSNQGNGNGNGKANSNNNDILKCLQTALCNQQLQHAEYLRRRKSLKNQIFQLRNYEAAAAATVVPTPAWQQRGGVPSDFHEFTVKDVDSEGEGKSSQVMMMHLLCTAFGCLVGGCLVRLVYWCWLYWCWYCCCCCLVTCSI